MSARTPSAAIVACAKCKKLVFEIKFPAKAGPVSGSFGTQRRRKLW
jgi:hypothetical protein